MAMLTPCIWSRIWFVPTILVAAGCALGEIPDQATRASGLAAEFVTWTNLVEVSVFDQASLIRGPGGDTAGASSAQQIEAGDGFVQFSTDEPDRAKMAGLGHSDESQYYSDIDYAIFLRSDGAIGIYEQGENHGWFGTYAPGDVFRVEVAAGQVRYRRNGVVFHSSTLSPTYPLALDTTLFDVGATVTAAQVASCAHGDTGCMPVEPWTNVRRVIADGDGLIRGPDGGPAGASSVQQIAAGDGFVQFSTAESNRAKMAGLGHSDDDESYSDIDYAIFLRSDGVIEIYEQGQYNGWFGTYASGDVFRVEVAGGQVRYRRNGLVLHSSALPPIYPLALDTTLLDVGATITAAQVASCAPGDTRCMPVEPWTNVRRVIADGDGLIRGPDGGPAGASSVQQIAAGDGFVQFSTAESNRAKMAGLGHSDDDESYSDIDYAIFLRSDGVIEIYEQGQYNGWFGTYASGDVFRVEVAGGQVRYRRNGLVFHSSALPPIYPLALDTTLFDVGATITAAQVASCAPGDPVCIAALPWKNVSYAIADRDLLTRGPGGSFAGASSVQQIAGGDGFVQFSTDESDRAKMAGLGHSDEDQSGEDIDYAFFLGSDGSVEIREQGAFRGWFGSYARGDVFRVEIAGPEVRYLRNGAVLYTSTTPPTYPLELDTSLYDTGATIRIAHAPIACGDVGPGQETGTARPTFCNLPTLKPDNARPGLDQPFGHTCTSITLADDYAHTAGKHSGIDLDVPARSALYSVGYGRVACVGENACEHFPKARGAPAQIDLTIRYGAVYVVYGHAYSSPLAAGDLVVPGQFVGESSLWLGRDHLHFEVRRVNGNQAIDPVQFFSDEIQPHLRAGITDAQFCTGRAGNQPEITPSNVPNPDDRPCTDDNDDTVGPIRCESLCTRWPFNDCTSRENPDDPEAPRIPQPYCSVYDCNGVAVCGLVRNTAAQACAAR